MAAALTAGAVGGAIDNTALVGELVVKSEAHSYSLYNSMGAKLIYEPFKEAWDTEEMNENGSSYIFKIDFQCMRCNSTHKEFPHINDGQFICSSCHEILQILC